MSLRATQRLTRGKKQKSFLALWGHAQADEMSSPPRGAETCKLIAVKQMSLSRSPGKDRGDERRTQPHCSLLSLPIALPGPEPAHFGNWTKRMPFLGEGRPLSTPSETQLRAEIYPQPHQNPNPGAAHRAVIRGKGMEGSLCPALLLRTAAN